MVVAVFACKTPLLSGQGQPAPESLLAKMAKHQFGDRPSPKGRRHKAVEEGVQYPPLATMHTAHTHTHTHAYAHAHCTHIHTCTHGREWSKSHACLPTLVISVCRRQRQEELFFKASLSYLSAYLRNKQKTIKICFQYILQTVLAL